VTSARLALFGGDSAIPPGTNFPCKWPVITEGDLARVSGALARSEISYDASEGLVAELEEAFKARLNRPYALATSSGTAALHSAFFAVGLEPGDEVIAPSYTFLATVMPIVACNATPVLADAEPDTGNIDLAHAETLVTTRTRAIVVTHLNGHPVDMTRAVEFARRYNLALIEDGSQAHGAVADHTEVGTRGDVAAFSLQGRKLVAAGEGGILVTSNRLFYERAVMLGHFDARSKQEVLSAPLKPFARLGFGLNYRMHPLGAALAIGQLERLDDNLAKRSVNFDALDVALSPVPGVGAAPRRPYVARHGCYSYQPVYDAEELDGLPRRVFVAALRAEGVPITVPTSPPLHLEPFFTAASTGIRTFVVSPGRPLYRAGQLPNSESYVNSALRLPAFPEPLGLGLIEGIKHALNKVSRSVGELHDYVRRSACVSG
jgi:dTDP-4-amino-4,6-dideoxygalactose transaminase